MLPFILKVATVVWIDSLGSASIGLFVTRNFVTRDWLNGNSSETFSLRESPGPFFLESLFQGDVG